MLRSLLYQGTGRCVKRSFDECDLYLTCEIKHIKKVGKEKFASLVNTRGEVVLRTKLSKIERILDYAKRRLRS